MGDFANTLFSVLLGWIRTAAEWLWSVTGSQNNGGLVGWIGENWIGLAVLVCAVGLGVDFVVHMIRWRPYKVWASFFRRMTGRTGKDEHADSGRLRRQWLYADGTTGYDEIPAEEAAHEPEPPAVLMMQSIQPQMQPEQDVPPHPAAPSPYARPADQPAPSWMEEPAEPETDEEQEPETMSRPQLPPVRRRRYIPLADEDEMPLRYSPPPVAEEAPAYNAPYIPPQWRKPSNTGAANNSQEDGGLGL